MTTPPRTYTTLAAGRSVTFDPSNPADRMTIQAYTRGQCFALATALHRATGWPVTLLLTASTTLPPGDRVADAPLVWTRRVQHALVRRPDGALVDIFGARDDEDVLSCSGHPDAVLAPASPAHLVELERVAPARPIRAAARVAAQAVLARFGEPAAQVAGQ